MAENTDAAYPGCPSEELNGLDEQDVEAAAAAVTGVYRAVIISALRGVQALPRIAPVKFFRPKAPRPAVGSPSASYLDRWGLVALHSVTSVAGSVALFTTHRAAIEGASGLAEELSPRLEAPLAALGQVAGGFAGGMLHGVVMAPFAPLAAGVLLQRGAPAAAAPAAAPAVFATPLLSSPHAAMSLGQRLRFMAGVARVTMLADALGFAAFFAMHAASQDRLALALDRTRGDRTASGGGGNSCSSGSGEMSTESSMGGGGDSGGLLGESVYVAAMTPSSRAERIVTVRGLRDCGTIGGANHAGDHEACAEGGAETIVLGSLGRWSASLSRGPHAALGILMLRFNKSEPSPTRAEPSTEPSATSQHSHGRVSVDVYLGGLCASLGSGALAGLAYHAVAFPITRAATLAHDAALAEATAAAAASTTMAGASVLMAPGLAGAWRAGRARGARQLFKGATRGCLRQVAIGAATFALYDFALATAAAAVQDLGLP